MDTLLAILGSIATLIKDLAIALWPIVPAIADATLWLLETYPLLGTLLLCGALAWFIYWFADGVRNWRRKCIPCRGTGAFGSKLSSRLNRPCKCCEGSPAGGGRHVSLRKRLWDRLKGTRT